VRSVSRPGMGDLGHFCPRQKNKNFLNRPLATFG
jgi:hypothetical protein